MEKNQVLDIIINLVQGVKKNQFLSPNFNDETFELDRCEYLLGQILRHYKIKPEQYFVSKEAFKTWSKISTDSIFNYTYRDKVTKNTYDFVLVDKYKGSEKYPHETNYALSYGESFIFNEVFIDEHVVPVNVLIKELINLPILDYNSVKRVLDKLSICKLLKKEDRKIKNKSFRSSNYEEVIYSDYLEAGIMIKDFDYKKNDIIKNNIKSENCNIIKEGIKAMHTTKKGEKGLKRKYCEYFTINNIQKVFRGKKGFPAINSKGQEIGIVFMGDDKRRNYGNCELCMYEKYFDTYGQWHRFTVNGQKIKWEDLVQRLNIENSIKLFIE